MFESDNNVNDDEVENTNQYNSIVNDLMKINSRPLNQAGDDWKLISQNIETDNSKSQVDVESDEESPKENENNEEEPACVNPIIDDQRLKKTQEYLEQRVKTFELCIKGMELLLIIIKERRKTHKDQIWDEKDEKFVSNLINKVYKEKKMAAENRLTKVQQILREKVIPLDFKIQQRKADQEFWQQKTFGIRQDIPELDEYLDSSMTDLVETKEEILTALDRWLCELQQPQQTRKRF